MKYRLFNTKTGASSSHSFGVEYNSVDRPDMFTGLIDKNGREIYENDIVRFYVGNEEYIESVKFDHETACFRFGKYAPSDSFLLLSGGIINLAVVGISNESSETSV